MPSYVSGYIATDVPQVYLALARWGQAIRRLKRVNPALARLHEREARDIARLFQSDLRRIETRTAARVTTAMRQRVIQTNVRPDPSGRLENALIAEPLVLRLATGSIGIANIERLDEEVVRPGGERFGPYWRSQEYGYSPRGKQLTGIYGGFFDAGEIGGRGARPDPGQFRDHAEFRASRQGAGKLVLTRDLPARGFIRDTIRAEKVLWLKDMHDVERAAISRVRRLI